MQKLVDDVGAGQTPGVKDGRLPALAVADHPDQAVADPAELVADREGRDPLQLDPPVTQAEPRLPVAEKGVRATVGNDNDSQSSLSYGGASPGDQRDAAPTPVQTGSSAPHALTARLRSMADWTKRNFEDIEDRSPAEVSMRWLFSRNEVGSTQVGVSRFSYEPGARMPFGHRHGVQEEVYVVVAGSGRAKLEDEIVEIALWDVLRVAPQVIRSFEAGPDGMEMICVGGTRPEGGDNEGFKDFWLD